MAISACKSNQGGEKIIAIDVANIDTSVRPQDDFYSYANGLWLKNNPIPSTETRWGAFSILQDQTNKKLKVLLDESAANTAAAKGSNEQGMFAGIAIGSVVLLEAMFAGPICGASMNPIRSLAPAITSGHVEHLWVYLIAPTLGAILAIFSWMALRDQSQNVGRIY